MSMVKSRANGSNIRAMWLGIVGTLFILVSALPLWCDEQGSSDPFLKRLRKQLREQNWQEQEIGALEREAYRFDWTNTQDADSRIVAYALQYARSHDNDLDMPFKARLTFELALSLGELSSNGYTVRTMTRMALGGTRDVIHKLQNQSREYNASEMDQDGVLGEMIRATLRSRVRADAGDEVHVRVRDGIGSQNKGYHQGDRSHNPLRGQNEGSQHGSGQNGNGGGNGGK